DLAVNIWTNVKEIPGDGLDNDGDELIDDVHGWNFVTNSPDVRPVFKDKQFEDAWSHGTVTASLLGAKGNNDIGIAGVIWNVRIMPLVVLGAEGEGKIVNLSKAIRYAVSHGAAIINFSLVGYEYDEALDRLIQNTVKAGVVVVTATGNDEQKAGLNIDDIPVYPACYDGTSNMVLGVSGTDTLDQKAPFANYGKSCTDVAAPAQELFAARPSYPHDRERATSTVPGYIDRMTGTSLAAPLVSGVAALIKSVRPEWTPQQIYRRIIETSDPIEDNLKPEEKGGLGAGRLNAGRALAGLAAGTIVAASTSVSSSVPSVEPILISSPTSSWVTFFDKRASSTRWQPYGLNLRGGIQSFTLPDDEGWLLWPTRGGGHAMVINREGRVVSRSFPFGKKRIGSWRL
ncbi:MAG: S8 family peptidase, partial [Candidatus Uhrbacteria bacterium]|nr:S8 family peptidase [Candidatus Uhrbacteria bacterium]